MNDELSMDELLEVMEKGDLEDLAEQTHLTPIEYAKLRGMTPQVVYYHIRRGTIKDERCKCGRRVVEVRSADEALQAKARASGRVVDTRDDAERSGTPVQGLSQESAVEEADDRVGEAYFYGSASLDL
jgi:hypothetical protein